MAYGWCNINPFELYFFVKLTELLFLLLRLAGKVCCPKLWKWLKKLVPFLKNWMCSVQGLAAGSSEHSNQPCSSIYEETGQANTPTVNFSRKTLLHSVSCKRTKVWEVVGSFKWLSLVSGGGLLSSKQ